MRSSYLIYFLVTLVLVGLVGGGAVASSNRDVEVAEVAWAGTEASWADEWIELRNLTDEKVDLTGWKLRWDGVKIDLGKEAGDTLKVRKSVLGPGEVLLLERTDDDTVSSVKADVIYKGSLANSGEEIVLENKSGKEVQVIEADEGWPAGSGSGGEKPYATMVLKDGKWENSESKGEAEDSGGNKIHGSPGKKEPKDK